jgi:hypothetical protein
MAWLASEQAVIAHRGEARMQLHPGPSPSALETVIVVEERGDFRWGESGAHIVTADEYLRESATVPQRRVMNLCREHTHLSAGYYVSLVAAARREEALPDVATIVDMEHAVFREKAGVGLERLLATAPKSSFVSAALSLHIYFGQTAHVAFRELANRAFEFLHAPLLRIDLEPGEPLRITDLRILAPKDVPKEHDALVLAGLERLRLATDRPRTISALLGHSRRPPRQDPSRAGRTRFDLAVLVNPNDKIPPSKGKTLARLADVGRGLGVEVTLIQPEDFEHTHFDALFMRETTAVSDHTYRFAREAQQRGTPVLDDPASIIRCANKVFLAELMRRGGVDIPGTRLLTRRTIADVAKARLPGRREDAGRLLQQGGRAGGRPG